MRDRAVPAPQLSAEERSAVLGWLSLSPSTPPAGDADFSWARVLDYLDVTMAPLVLHGISRGTATAPPEVVEELRALQRMVAVKSLQQRSVLRTVCASLDDASIPFLVLKGAALAHLVYPDPVLRWMTDLDVWVAPDRLDAAAAALRGSGLDHPRDLAASYPVAQPPDRLPSRTLHAPGAPVEVELHGHIRSLVGLSWARFDLAWSASEPASLGGIGARVQCPEHLLTHLCLHLARNHAFERSLPALLDIALVTRRWGTRWDWSRMLREWQQERVATWVVLSLVLARDLLGAPVPPDLEAQLRLPDEWPAIRALAVERLWDARGHRLQPLLATIARERSLTGRLHWLRIRLVDHYWRSSEPRGIASALHEGLRRLGHDLRVNVPGYLRAWRVGSLRGPALARGIALAQGRQELERLVTAAGDVGYAPPPEAAPSAEP